MEKKQFLAFLYSICLLYSCQVYSQEKCEVYYKNILKNKESEKNDSEIIKKSIANSGEYVISILWKDNTKSDLILYKNSISDKVYNYVKIKDKVLIKKDFNYLGFIRYEDNGIFIVESFKLCE